MKKLYSLLLLSFFITELGNAQNFIYPDGQHRYDTVINPSYESYTINVNTPTPEAITYKYELLVNTLPASWSYNVCDYTDCHVIPLPTSVTMSPISLANANLGVNGFWKLTLTTGLENYGDGVLMWYAYDSTDYNRGDTVSFNINYSNPLSINETSTNFITYPNPVTEALTIVNESSTSGILVVFDVFGKHIYSKSIQPGANHNIDFSDYLSGVYWAKLTSSQGFATIKQIIKQ